MAGAVGVTVRPDDSGPGAYSVFGAALSRAACRLAIEAMQHGTERAGGVLRAGDEVRDLRLRSCIEHHTDARTAAAMSECLWAVAEAVAGHGRLPGCRLDGPKFCRYPAGGYFRAHRDRSADPRDPADVRQRTLSFSCLLNDDDPAGGLPTFDGGTLVLYVPQPDGRVAPVNLRPAAGTVVAFDSSLMHEVRPVHAGVRYAAVAWLIVPRPPLTEGSQDGRTL
jgi:predicted 2-oxoglutarate/Fe(II)-dependent dioxygenase YbiX